VYTELNYQALRTPRPEPKFIDEWPQPRPHSPPKRHPRIRLRNRQS
jgi:hypothetical protein